VFFVRSGGTGGIGEKPHSRQARSVPVASTVRDCLSPTVLGRVFPQVIEALRPRPRLRTRPSETRSGKGRLTVWHWCAWSPSSSWQW